MQFREGQIVTCAINGVGVVTDIDGDTDFYPVTVEFVNPTNEESFVEEYSADGKLNTNDYCAVLFPDECEIEIKAKRKRPLKYGDIVRFKSKSIADCGLCRVGVVQFCDYIRATEGFCVSTAKIEQDGIINNDELFEFNYDDYEWRVLK